MTGETCSRAIVVVSIGERHRAFYSRTRPFLERYAARIDAAIINIDDTQTIPSELSSAVQARAEASAREPLPYVAKCLAIHRALGTFERVALLDSTCLVSAACPDLFAAVPSPAVGGYDESANRDFASWQIDGRLAREKRGIELATYFNTGVLVVSRCHRSLFSPEAIVANLDLFAGPYADQLYVNVQLAQHAVPLCRLSRRYNHVPIFDYGDASQRKLVSLSNSQLRVLQDEAWIVHVTGYYEQRESILGQIAMAMESSQRSATGGDGTSAVKQTKI